MRNDPLCYEFRANFSERILSIRKIDDFSYRNEYFFERMAGYEIKTRYTSVYVLISNTQHCCEKFGYVYTADFDLEDYINTVIKKVVIKRGGFTEDRDRAEFVDIETSIGTLQFCVYNDNSSYSHGTTVLVVNDSDNNKIIFESSGCV